MELGATGQGGRAPVPRLRFEGNPIDEFPDDNVSHESLENGHDQGFDRLQNENAHPRLDDNGHGHQERDLCSLLRDSVATHLDEGGEFWGYGRLRRIMNRQKLVLALKSTACGSLAWREAEHVCDQILPPDASISPPRLSYLRIFALLILVNRGSDVVMFLEPTLADQNITLGAKSFFFDLTEEHRWNPTDKDLGRYRLPQLVVPYFDTGSAGQSHEHRVFSPGTVLPWIQREASDHNENQVKNGGYSSVSIFAIDSDSHNFKPILEPAGFKSDLVAVKTLNLKKGAPNTDDVYFKNELEMLKRFGGQAHRKETGQAQRHIIPLLASYDIGHDHSFIFPAARYNLEEYFGANDGPLASPDKTIDLARILWVSEQLLGLVAAVNFMHSASKSQANLAKLEPDKYARHGDLKLENIFWFESEKYPMGLFVLGDLGIADMHGEHSRSAVPNDNLATTPVYRAPECDIYDAKISRAYDIWTLGCVLLEAVCWILGGDKLRKRWNEKRMRTSILATRTYNYFEIIPNNESYSFRLKESVIETVKDLHKRPGCTQYIHDLLDMISIGMLRIMPADRYGAKKVSSTLESMHVKSEDGDYIAKPKPEERDQGVNKDDERSCKRLCENIERQMNKQREWAAIEDWGSTGEVTGGTIRSTTSKI